MTKAQIVKVLTDLSRLTVELQIDIMKLQADVNKIKAPIEAEEAYRALSEEARKFYWKENP